MDQLATFTDTQMGYVKCICLWHTSYPDERVIGKPNCPAHPGDDRDESKYDRDE